MFLVLSVFSELEPFDTTWCIVAVILAAIGLIILGCASSIDGFSGDVVTSAISIVLCSVFWPIFLGILLIIIVISIPILIGKYSMKIIKFFKNRKQKKMNNLNSKINELLKG